LTQGQPAGISFPEPSIPLSYRLCGTLLLRRLQITAYKAIQDPVIPEMMYGSLNGKTFVLGDYVTRERALQTGNGKKGEPNILLQLIWGLYTMNDRELKLSIIMN
jgi:hypothetical protein